MARLLPKRTADNDTVMGTWGRTQVAEEDTGRRSFVRQSYRRNAVDRQGIWDWKRMVRHQETSMVHDTRCVATPFATRLAITMCLPACWG